MSIFYAIIAQDKSVVQIGKSSNKEMMFSFEDYVEITESEYKIMEELPCLWFYEEGKFCRKARTLLIEQRREDAIKHLSALARLAHQRHEDQGGYAMEHAVDVVSAISHPGAGVAAKSIERHRSIEEARRRAIQVIKSAPHGAALAETIEQFTKEIEL